MNPDSLLPIVETFSDKIKQYLAAIEALQVFWVKGVLPFQVSDHVFYEQQYHKYVELSRDLNSQIMEIMPILINRNEYLRVAIDNIN